MEMVSERAVHQDHADAGSGFFHHRRAGNGFAQGMWPKLRTAVGRAYVMGDRGSVAHEVTRQTQLTRMASSSAKHLLFPLRIFVEWTISLQRPPSKLCLE